MPLNPEEVVNKRFSATKFRQGYDEEEVDEFLDEVVADLRRLNAENAELRSKLAACEGRVTELAKAGANQPGAKPVGVPSQQGPSSQPALTGQPAATSQPALTSQPVTAAATSPVAPAAPVAPQTPPAPSTGVDSAAGVLALAQRLHDEHVTAGQTKGAKLVSDAQEQASRLIRDAEEKQRQTLGALQTQRQALENSVEELRAFEREYRSRLKAYLESQLRDLQNRPIAGPAPAGLAPSVGAAPGPGGAAAPQGSGSAPGA